MNSLVALIWTLGFPLLGEELRAAELRGGDRVGVLPVNHLANGLVKGTMWQPSEQPHEPASAPHPAVHHAGHAP